MKLTVKTLKGTHFEIRVQPNDTVRYSDPHFIFEIVLVLLIRDASWVRALVAPQINDSR